MMLILTISKDIGNVCSPEQGLSISALVIPALGETPVFTDRPTDD